MGDRENKVEKYLSDNVEELGGICRKWVSPGHAGVPDQIVIIGSDVTFVEVKTVDGVLESHQIREQNRLRTFGAQVTTVYGHEGVDQFINRLRFGG